MKFSHFFALVSGALVYVQAQTVVLTNDDGWAVAQLRAQYNTLKATPGFNVILSAPTQNESGTGSKTSNPTPLNTTCEFNSCPVGSSAEGPDPNDPRLNFVNGFPSVARPMFSDLQSRFYSVWVANAGAQVFWLWCKTSPGAKWNKHRMGAASEAALEGIPSVAFSGASGSQVSFTTLNQTTASSTVAANIYTSLYVKFTNALLNNPAPLLPPGISVNVNFASITNCPSASSYQFVFTRLLASSTATDVETCGTNHLPAEGTAINMGCIATVSAFNASNKGDVDAATQGAVLSKLTSILSCL